MNTEAMKQALEALELMYACYAHPDWISHKQQEEKILAQCVATTMTLRKDIQEAEKQTRPWFTIDELNAWGDEYLRKKAIQEEALREVQRIGQEIEQEPVAWKTDDIELYVREDKFGPYNIPLYTHPQIKQDWSTQEAALESLREHMARIKELEAQLEQMKNQKPVAWIDSSGHPKHLRHIQSSEERRLYGVLQPLYLHPQPKQEQGEPVAWHPIEAMYPQGEQLDIRMGDGSILCDVLPQYDGDLWWGGSGTGEKFIDPKYADVTHWRIHSDTHPQPKREWVGLTDAEVGDIVSYPWGETKDWVKAIEAKLKEKNT